MAVKKGCFECDDQGINIFYCYKINQVFIYVHLYYMPNSIFIVYPFFPDSFYFATFNKKIYKNLNDIFLY